MNNDSLERSLVLISSSHSQNPAYFEDKDPFKLNPIAGVAFEWWTMQDGILVDNIFIGNDEKAAADFAAATFDVKHAIEAELEKASKPDLPESAEELDTSDFSIPAFLADPVTYGRNKVVTFVKVATRDPLGAFKTMPQAGAIVGGLAATLIGMIGILLGLLAPKPATVQAKTKKVKEVTIQAAKDVKEQATAVTSSTNTGQAADGSEVKMRPVTRSTAPAPN
jgi:hypothetical protein